MKQPTAVIADDEAPLRTFLRRRLAECWPELKIVGEAENGQEALEMITALQPDVAFLDIRMPLLSGLEVAGRLDPGLHLNLVFVTAYDEHAIQAFDNAAVDYLLKPVSLQRLAKTAERLKSMLVAEPVDLSQLLARLPAELSGKPNYLQRVQASTTDGIVMVPVDSVDYFQAADKYTLVVTGDKQWIIRKSLKELEAALDPERFWRVHRNAIVRLDAIERAVHDERGSLTLHLLGQKQPLSVGRNYLHRFKAD
ncbi:MAG: LytTR family DNA-binding domain-containing protein [Proteobacteria bacterium]|nr:LytTR family DNA-binding domain-containing protein [Pseudomonadota bacterium]